MNHFRRSSLRALSALVAGGIAVSAGVASATPPPTEPATSPPQAGAAPTTVPPTTVPPTTAAPSTAPPTTVAAVTYPLTGVAVADPASFVPRPALIVKIDNGVNSHPQSGLNQADIVFEEIVEGRVTRFAAVFNSMDSDPVGNIRSGRTQDVALFGSYNDPIFAFSGANARVNEALAATGWTLLTQGNGMFRVEGRGGAPYNLFGNTSEFFAQAGDAGEAVPQFEYGVPSGVPVTSMDLGIGGYDVNWTWDAAQGLFLRTQGGDPHMLSDGQASANTVIVLLVPYGTSPADSNSPEAQTVGSGQAIVYSGGLVLEATWTRPDASSPFVLEAGGAPVLLAPGRTWVELADAGSYELTDDATG